MEGAQSAEGMRCVTGKSQEPSLDLAAVEPSASTGQLLHQRPRFKSRSATYSFCQFGKWLKLFGLSCVN